MLEYTVYEDECRAAGLDIKKVTSIARRFSKVAKEADEMGIEIFGGSGNGSLRFSDKYRDVRGQLILAHLDGMWDGGAGDCCEHSEDGLLRGEI